jgi:gliding motility-associated-like protein
MIHQTIILFIIVVFINSPLIAQSLITPFGAVVENQTLCLSYSSGEIAIATLQNNNTVITQGFQQPQIDIMQPETAIKINSGLILDADNDNGVFLINEIEDYPNNKLIILNRWGNVLFEAQPYQNDWRGYYNNVPLPQASYYYIFYPNSQQAVTIKGNIYLLRTN